MLKTVLRALDLAYWLGAFAYVTWVTYDPNYNLFSFQDPFKTPSMSLDKILKLKILQLIVITYLAVCDAVIRYQPALFLYEPYHWEALFEWIDNRLLAVAIMLQRIFIMNAKLHILRK